MRKELWGILLAILFAYDAKATADPDPRPRHRVTVIQEYNSQRAGLSQDLRLRESRNIEQEESHSFNQEQETSSTLQSNQSSQTSTFHDESQSQQQSSSVHDESQSQQESSSFHDESQSQHESSSFHNESQSQQASSSFHDESQSQHESSSFHNESQSQQESSSFHDESQSHQESSSFKEEQSLSIDDIQGSVPNNNLMSRKEDEKIRESRDAVHEHGHGHGFDLDSEDLSKYSKEMEDAPVTDEEIGVISDNMIYVTGAKSPREASDIMYGLTGFRNEVDAIKYVMNVTEISSKDLVYSFMRKARGSRSWKFVIEFLDTLQGTSNIDVIVALLREFTNQKDLFKAFKVLRSLTGHADFDGIFESLQKMSGEKYIHEISDHFKHKSFNQVDGLAGVRKEVLDITGGIGPEEFPRVMKVLLPEVDVNGAFNLLILATRTGEIGEAIPEFVKIMKAKTISEAILLLKKVTKQTQFKYALEELTQASNRGSIKVIVNSLYRITGRDNMIDVQNIINDVFDSDNLVAAMQKINIVTKLQDPIYFLTSLLDVTRSRYISSARNVIKGLTEKKMPFLDILEQIQIKSGHDILDFFKKLIILTGTKSVRQAWEALKAATSITDIFVLFDTVSKYTSVDLIVFMETIIRITNSTNISNAAGMLCKISNKSNFIDVIQSISEITEMDVVKLFEVIITISKRFFFDEVVVIIEEYTDTTNFIDALADIRRATGQQDIMSAIEYIKANKPRIERTTTTTTTTTEEPTTTTTEEPTTTTTEPTTTTTEEPTTTTTEPTTTTTEPTTTTTEQTTTTTEPTTTTTEEPTTTTTEPTTTTSSTTTTTEEPATTETKTTTTEATTTSTEPTTTTTTKPETTTSEAPTTTQPEINISKLTTTVTEAITTEVTATEAQSDESGDISDKSGNTVMVIKQNEDGTYFVYAHPIQDISTTTTEQSIEQATTEGHDGKSGTEITTLVELQTPLTDSKSSLETTTVFIGSATESYTTVDSVLNNVATTEVTVVQTVDSNTVTEQETIKQTDTEINKNEIDIVEHDQNSSVSNLTDNSQTISKDAYYADTTDSNDLAYNKEHNATISDKIEKSTIISSSEEFSGKTSNEKHIIIVDESGEIYTEDYQQYDDSFGNGKYESYTESSESLETVTCIPDSIEEDNNIVIEQSAETSTDDYTDVSNETGKAIHSKKTFRQTHYQSTGEIQYSKEYADSNSGDIEDNSESRSKEGTTKSDENSDYNQTYEESYERIHETSESEVISEETTKSHEADRSKEKKGISCENGSQKSKAENEAGTSQATNKGCAILALQVKRNKTDNCKTQTEDTTQQVKTTAAPELQPKPPGQLLGCEETTTEIAPKAGGKLALNQGKRDIMHALEASMNLKVLILPNGPAGKNCFCTCESDGSPKLIPVNALPAGLTQA